MVDKIVLCFDGTWNQPAALKQSEKIYDTNVKRMADALSGTGPQQQVFYHRGVGTAGAWDRLLGGATGWGISSTILAGYRQIVEHYQAGADIYLFGFSRGAYTARSLSGFVHLVGVLDRDAVERYQWETGRDLFTLDLQVFFS